VGIGEAARLAMHEFAEHNDRIRNLRDKLEKGLVGKVSACHRNGHKDQRLPNTLNIGFEYVEGEAILMRMDDQGICASSGSACTSGSLEPSHVLRAMGVPFTSVHGSIRFSLSRYTTEEEVDYVVQVVPGIIEFLRSVSPFGRESMATACTVN
jgi:cysteine desulfurase